MKVTISAKTIKKLKPGKKPYEVRDDQLKGFLLRVYPSGRLTYFAEYGRGKKYTIGTADKLKPVQARDEARKKLAGAVRGIDPMAERKAKKAETLGEYLDNLYGPWAASHFKTGDRQAGRIRSCFPDLLKKKLPEITPWLIEKYRSRRLKDGLTVRTVNKDVQALRAALRRAADWGIVREHPLQKMKGLKEDTGSRIRYLSEEEETCLRAALDTREEAIRQGRDRGNAWRRQRGYPELPNLRTVPFAERLKPLVLLDLNTGLRRGELFNLKWPDIDLSRKLLTVGGAGAKTSQTRHVPLNVEALEVLTDWRAQSAGEGYVFPADDGGRLDNINKSWRSTMKAAKIAGFRFHDCRHTFASNLVMAGVDLNTVRELLGHSDLKMTLRYAHLAPEHKAAAVEKLGRKAQEAKKIRGTG